MNYIVVCPSRIVSQLKVLTETYFHEGRGKGGGGSILDTSNTF